MSGLAGTLFVEKDKLVGLVEVERFSRIQSYYFGKIRNTISCLDVKIHLWLKSCQTLIIEMTTHTLIIILDC